MLPAPLPLLFIRFGSKGFSVYVSGLESTLAGISISVDSKGVGAADWGGVYGGVGGGSGDGKALAAIGEGETTQELAVLWSERRHKFLLRGAILDCLRKSAQAEGSGTKDE